ncbi:arylamine N-acetyltransferase [Macrococcus hajekii]|uniref:Arylamine N-acetyltransferase n=1 Tax=Macrococcus hajekii TaxID=198482 RepID=A0A4R6BMZ5_9STAP|nr:arylamine N-acetyltransferase [Macrococcus hajekii]TDM03213.1 arylamine N-acetyltransferase [Macrococcus hajekii]GGA96936.1 N-hydroxyarylamine O-acetyltransferase [Macrococcus hajekii]
MINDFEQYLGYMIQEPTLEELNHAIRHFMLKVPFENIDVQNKKEISVEVNDLFNKVVKQQRGGFCYELNGLFHYYLKEKGYKVSYAAGTIKGPEGWRMLGSHMLNLVDIDGQLHVADVGFGDLPTQAMPIDGPPITDQNGVFRAIGIDGKWFEVQKQEEQDFKVLYKAEYAPKSLSEFSEAIDYNQHSPESIFVRKLLITQTKENGRATMTENYMSVITPISKKRFKVTAENYRQLLHENFNLDLKINRFKQETDS